MDVKCADKKFKNTAGSINRAENKDKKDNEIYKGIIKNHIQDEWRFK